MRGTAAERASLIAAKTTSAQACATDARRPPHTSGWPTGPLPRLRRDDSAAQRVRCTSAALAGADLFAIVARHDEHHGRRSRSAPAVGITIGV
jgi:hypothetical protein